MTGSGKTPKPQVLSRSLLGRVFMCDHYTILILEDLVTLRCEPGASAQQSQHLSSEARALELMPTRPILALKPQVVGARSKYPGTRKRIRCTP